ncbi:MAG: hypothetical protein R3Y45_04715 [Bacillota bacterium]
MDYKFIRQKLDGELKKHKPVFDELYLNGLTLQEYAEHIGKKGSVQYKIKWNNLQNSS